MASASPALTPSGRRAATSGPARSFPAIRPGSYATPEFAGIQLNYGIYDPATFGGGATSDWSRAPYPRQEGALTLTRPFGTTGNSFKLSVEGLFQPVYRIATTTDPTTMAMTRSNVSSSVWGVSGGARVEVGAMRLGVSGFRGRGTGLGNALQKISATSDDDQGVAVATGLTYGLRTFTGFYGQLGAVIQKWQLAAGYGMGIVDQLAVDKINPNISVIHTQTGISGAIYYHLADSVVLGLDYFHFKASWYGAPLVDTATGLPTGGKLAGELQNLDFVNLGVTYHW